MKKAFRVAVALVVLAVLVAAAIHSSPVRRYVLRRAIATVQEQLGIRLQAEDLSYDIVNLRIQLRGVRAAAVESADTPFFEARVVTVQIPTSAVLGPFTIEAVALEDGRVRVVREATGETNLPTAKSRGGPPQALRLDSFVARGLAVDLVDRRSRSSLALPSIDLTLSPDSGSIALRAPGRVTRGDVTTTMRRLEGGVAFDGRTLTLSTIELQTDEADATLDGTVSLLVEEPALDVRVAARGDAARLSRWADLDDPPRGTLDVAADVSGPLTMPAATVAVVSPKIDWRELSVTDLTASTRVTTDRLEVDRFEARLASGRIVARASMPFDGKATRVDLSWDGVDVETLASMAGLATVARPSGRASGSLNAHGPGGSLAQWIAKGHVDVSGGTTGPNRLAVAGRVNVALDRAEWGIGAPEPLLVGGVGLRPTLSGRLDFEAFERSTIRGLVELFETPVRQAADLLRRTGIAALDLPDVNGSVEAQAVISGRAGAPVVAATGRVQIADLAPLAPGTPLAGPGYLELESDLRTAQIVAGAQDVPIFAKGRVELRRPFKTSLELMAPYVELQRALRGVETPVPIAGTVTVTARATGALDAWRDGRVEIDVENAEARVGELPVRLASPARASVVAQVVDITALNVIAGEIRVSASGRLRLVDTAAAVPDASALHVRATGDLAQFINAIGATGVVDLPDLSGTGPAALQARIVGSALNPRVFGDLELGPGTVQRAGLPAASDVTLRVRADGTWIELRDLSAEWQGSRIQGSGRVPFAWAIDRGGSQRSSQETAVLTATLTSVTQRVLEPFAEADTIGQIAGSVDATLHVQSASPDLAALAGELRLDRMELRIADLPVAQREPTRVTFRDGFAHVESWQWTGQGATVGVEGRVRLADGQAGLLANGRFDLRMLTPFTRDAGIVVAGTLEPKVSITGDVASPRVDGVAALVDGTVRLTDPRVIATDLDGHVVLSRSRAQLTSLSGIVNGGTLSGKGSVEYTPGGPLDTALTLDVDGMALEFPEGLNSELNARVGVTLTVPAGEAEKPSGQVDGLVTIVRSAYREPIGVAAGLLTALRTRQLAAETASVEPSLADNLTLDVGLVTDEDLIVDNNIGRLAVGADLRLIGTLAAPALSGRAQLAEGGQLFLGRNRYEIQSGTFDFVNPVAIDPEMTIQATTRAGGQDIELTIKGTPEQPSIDLRSPSNSDLTDADLASLLLTGRALDEISGDEAEIVSEQAIAYLSGDLLGFASRAVGLDTIRLGGVEGSSRSGDTAAIATEIDPTARLTFGKSIGRNVDVTFSQGLRDTAAQTWIVDYRPRRQLELRLVSDDEDLRSYEFRHDVSFGGASLSDAPTAPRTPRKRPRVAAATVTGGGAVTEERLRSVLRLEPGDELDFAAWQRDRDSLEDVLHGEGFCEARVVARREGDDAVTLVYAVTPGPRCTIEVSGYALDDATTEAVRRAWTESVFDDFLVEETQGIVRARLSREGHLQAKVTAALTSNADQKRLSIRIDPGPRVTLRTVRFEGVEGPLAAALHEWAALRPAGAQATGDPQAFERALTMWLHARGHVRAKVTVGVPAIQGTEAIVPVTVDAGPSFVVSDVRLEGVRALGTEAPQAIGIEPGVPFDPVVVEAARDRLQARYRREGFNAAKVNTKPSIDEQARAVTVVFVVAEGPRQVVGDVRVLGNRAIDPDVITRALELPVGEPVGVDDWLQARRRLFDTGLFRRVEVTPEPMEAPPPDGGQLPVSARVVVQEWPALRLRYGFEIAEERPEGEVEGRDLVPGLSADITRRTLFGRAITLGAALDYQRREQGGRGFVRSRTLLGWPIESSFLIERSREEFAANTLVTSLTTASWEQRLRVARNVRLSYAYRFERNRTRDTEAIPGDEFEFDLTVNTALLNGTAAWDTRDNVADATRGWLLSSSMDWAPAGLGSDFRFLKQIAQAYYFRPWRGVVLASAARLGVAVPLGGQDLEPSRRFFAGGARTVRGVEDDELGPRTLLGDPAGGESLLVFNQEMRFPIYKWLRGAGFLDAGNVWAEASGIELGDLVAGYGVGLRLATPFALFRVDYSRLFDPRSGDRASRWIFGIGQAF